MADERGEKLKKLENINKLLNPQNYVKYKNKLETKEKYLKLINEEEIDKEIKKYILDLQKIFLSCYRIKIKNTNNKQELIKLIYEFRYYCLIPITEEKLVSEIKEISSSIKEVQMLLLKKAHEFKAIDTFGKDEETDYQILKNIFYIRVINLEEIYIKITKEKEKYYIQLFDENVFEENEELKNINKDDLLLKVNKKARLFN